MILAVMKAIHVTAYIETWKIQVFNGVWTRDLAILVRRSNQLSYEAYLGPHQTKLRKTYYLQEKSNVEFKSSYHT